MRKIIAILLLIFAVCLMVLAFTACNKYGPSLFPEDDPFWHHDPPQPIVFHCDHYTPATQPHYIQGWCEMDGPPDGWVLHVGQYTDTVFAGQESELDAKLSLLINALVPQYQTEVYSREDARRIAIFTKGTDDQNALNFKVWIQVANTKYFPAFSKRAFYLGGAVTPLEWMQLCEEYASATGFNLRDFDSPNPPDSLKENEAMKQRVDSCTLCEGCRADFRFNQFTPSDSIIQAYKDAHWNTITSLWDGDIEARSSGHTVGIFRENGIMDARGHCLTDDEILNILNDGHPVITD